MSETQLADLEVSLRALSEFDRDRLLGNLVPAKKVMRRLTRDEQRVWDALCSVLKSNIAHKFLGSYGRDRFAGRCEEVYAYISAARAHLREAQLQALILLCFQCLAGYLRACEKPVGPKTLLDSVDSISHAVDRAFPGYAQAGLLHRVVGPSEIA